MTVSRKTDDLLENDLRRLVSRSAHLVEKQMQHATSDFEEGQRLTGRKFLRL